MKETHLELKGKLEKLDEEIAKKLRMREALDEQVRFTAPGKERKPNRYYVKDVFFSKAKSITKGEEEFEACAEFAGPREGCVFKSGEAGVGYYRDVRVPVGDVVAPPPAPQPAAAAAAPPPTAALSDEPCAELKSKGNALFKARKWSAPSTSSSSCFS